MATLRIHPEPNQMFLTMPRKQRMSGLDRALKDVEEGRVTRWNSVEEMFKHLNEET